MMRTFPWTNDRLRQEEVSERGDNASDSTKIRFDTCSQSLAAAAANGLSFSVWRIDSNSLFRYKKTVKGERARRHQTSCKQAPIYRRPAPSAVHTRNVFATIDPDREHQGYFSSLRRKEVSVKLEKARLFSLPTSENGDDR